MIPENEEDLAHTPGHTIPRNTAPGRRCGWSRRAWSCGALIAAVFAIAGCATAPSATCVVAAKQPREVASLRGSYRLVTAPPSARSYQQISSAALQRIHAGLAAQGFVQALPGSEPEFVVEVSANLRLRRASDRAAEQSGLVESVSTTAVVNRPPSPPVPQFNPRDPNSVNVTTGGGINPHDQEKSPTLNTTPSALDYSTADAGLLETNTSYEKRLDFVIRENPEIVRDASPRTISAIAVVSHGRTSSTDDALPMLIAVAFDTLGRGRSLNTIVTVRAEDGRFVVDG